jgi:hypothetical protein
MGLVHPTCGGGCPRGCPGCGGARSGGVTRVGRRVTRVIGPVRAPAARPAPAHTFFQGVRHFLGGGPWAARARAGRGGGRPAAASPPGLRARSRLIPRRPSRQHYFRPSQIFCGPLPDISSAGPDFSGRRARPQPPRPRPAHLPRRPAPRAPHPCAGPACPRPPTFWLTIPVNRAQRSRRRTILMLPDTWGGLGGARHGSEGGVGVRVASGRRRLGPLAAPSPQPPAPGPTTARSIAVSPLAFSRKGSALAGGAQGQAGLFGFQAVQSVTRWGGAAERTAAHQCRLLLPQRVPLQRPLAACAEPPPPQPAPPHL